MALEKERSDKATSKTQVDRFEKVQNPHRVGVHRAGEQIGSAKTKWLFIFLTSLLLATIGIIFVQIQPGNEKYSQSKPATEGAPKQSKVVGVIDADATVVVLNGTEIDDLSYFVDDQISSNSWGQMIFSGHANTSDVVTSAIFYSDSADEVAALGLGEKLGGIKAYQDEGYVTFDNQLTVLLGADYQGPGLEEAIESTHPRVDEPSDGLGDDLGDDLAPESDGFVEDGFVEDGIVGDGTIEDGTFEDGNFGDGTIDEGIFEDEIVEDGVVDPLSEGQENV